MSDVQVIGLPQSNFVWAVRIALAEKRVRHESVAAAPHSPEVTALHPLGKIPVLRHGEVTLCESRAIIDYADRVFEGPRLSPESPILAAHEDAWTSIVTSSIEPLLIRRFFFAYAFPQGAGGAPDRAEIEALAPEVGNALDVLERALEVGSIGRHGFRRTDAYLVPILFYVRGTPEGGEMIAQRPLLSEYVTRNMGRPSVLETMPPAPAAGGI